MPNDYNGHEVRIRRRVSINFEGAESRTKQSFKDECDINTILGKWRKTGFFSHVNLKTPVYADFTNAEDYLSAVNRLKNADAIFAALPARVRARVNNDPAQLIAFAEDPANAQELIDLGLEPTPPNDPEPAPAQADAPDPGGKPTDTEQPAVSQTS